MVSKISGIYAYYDNLRCKIVYVGRDSNIDKHSRHKAHYKPSAKDSQKINKILQNDNSGRYFYVVLEQGDFTNEELNQKEISWISFFKPKFNFTDGGDGVCGYRHTKQAREKMSRALSGEKNPMYGKTGEKNPMYGQKHTKETRKKISKANKGRFSGENHPRFDPCIKIQKQECKSCTQGFRWSARPHIPEKQKTLSSVDLEKCIEKVEDFLKSEKNVYGYDSYEVVE